MGKKALSDMARTIVEKILSNHSKAEVKAGDFTVCKVDFAFGQDGTSSIIIDRIEELGLKHLMIPFCMVIDHSAPSPNEGVSRVHKKMRIFAGRFRSLLFDIGCGICHQVIPESGNILPGDLILGADSHTSTYGALGAFASGVGSTDLAISLATGKNWFRVPQTIKIVLKGKLPKGVFAKDIILFIIGDMKADGATYKSIEFCGPAIDRLSMDARFTITNMVVEMGAKCGFMPVDDKTINWLKPRVKKRRKIDAISPDKHAEYCIVREYDVSKIEPQIACPHTVDNARSIGSLKDTPINQAFLGTCTNARLEDLQIAARVLKGKKIKPGIRFIVAPSSKEIFKKILTSGIVRLFVDAGAVIVAPGCGPCVGTHNGIPADKEVVISTANRNFKGRMGNPNASIYLASPATVVASAIEGRITDPRRYLS